MTPNLNRKLELQQLTRTPDGAGGFDETWTPLGTIWAAIRPTSGREGESDHIRLSKVGVDITVRAAPIDAPSRPKPDQRLVENTRVYRILAVTEKDARGHYLTCSAVEEVAS